MYVELAHVSFAHDGGELLFNEVCQRFSPGITAIVGENGAGKSTLLSLLTRSLLPQRGSVRIEPHTLRVVMCPQRVEELTREVTSFMTSSERTARRLVGMLALEREDLDRWNTLSPGERRRFQLGACLAEEPDVLLLDEPTNHVDERARELILGALRHFRGICLVVSHDRRLIDELAQCTVRVHRGQLWAVEGSYSHARKVWEHARAEQVSRRNQALRETQKAERKLRDARRVQASADAARSTRSRMRNANDSEARSMGARNMADWAEARAGRAVSVLRDEAEARRAELANQRVEKELGRDVFARFSPCPRPKLLTLHKDQLLRGDHVVASDVRLTILRDTRLRISGDNGAGKTTLLMALYEAMPDPERVLYLAQELTRAQALAELESTRSMPRKERGQVLEVLAALGTDPDRLLASACPSPGEARKLTLARGLARSAWALLLDEPTNHLDLPSVERIEAALASYPGALVVVTHDPTFLAHELHQHLHLQGGKLQAL
jgi:ATPase subunit of ABC transporter with duplicated ATPase domains